MKKELSAYLDLLRISAAALVFLGHLSWNEISGGFLWQLQPFGHGAVIIFFVLSGFVIQFAAATKERTLFDYSVARLARLYSVVLPAIVLTVVCDTIGAHHNPSAYILDRETSPALRMIDAALFLSQSWGHLSLFSNDAYWSLPHEFWYYVIFAALTYLEGWKRIAATVACAAIAGPGILILGPIWAFGAIAYRISQKFKLGAHTAASLWFMTAVTIVILMRADTRPITAVSPFLPTAYSGLDFLLGAAVAGNIICASFLSFGIARIHRPVAYVAGMTFALYLFHLPLLHLASAYLPKSLPSIARGAMEAVFALAAVFLLSFVTEGQKHRWRAALRWILQPMAENLQSQFNRQADQPIEP